MGDYKYKAFISYSHKDRKWTRWLHRRLETYPIPKNIIGKTTPAGIIPKRLKPIFRDREELSASNNLGEKIQAALASSKNLIIICSPAAAQSKWVNQEILTFKQNNRDAQLFSVIVEGEPYASTMPGREAEECFPPALRFEVNADGTLSDSPAEPLAADLRPHADGKRLGFLKLLSGMIGVGLDEVVQRDMKRSRKRVTAITTGSLATVLAMGTLTGFALTSQKEAETQRGIAQTRTASAEELIEFMVTDLKDKLDEVGRLDALQAVGQKASDYYDQYGLSEHDDNALGRRARVFHILGEIQDDIGNYTEAERYYLKADKATENLISRDPKNVDRIFEHSQSQFFRGYTFFRKGDYVNAKPLFEGYYKFAQSFYDLQPHSEMAQAELAYSKFNLGIVQYKLKNYNIAEILFHEIIPHFEELLIKYPQTKQYREDLADALGWQSDLIAMIGDVQDAIGLRKRQNAVLKAVLEENELNNEIRLRHLQSRYASMKLHWQIGDLEHFDRFITELSLDSKKLFDHEPSSVPARKVLIRIKLLQINRHIFAGNYNFARDNMKDAEALLNDILPEGGIKDIDTLKIIGNVNSLKFMLNIRVSDGGSELYNTDKLYDYLKLISSDCSLSDELVLICARAEFLVYLIKRNPSYLRNAIGLFEAVAEDSIPASMKSYFSLALKHDKQIGKSSAMMKELEQRNYSLQHLLSFPSHTKINSVN